MPPKTSGTVQGANAGDTVPRKTIKEESPKRPLKERVQLEFMVRSAPAVLYDLVSTPSGFAEWYCNDVNTKGDLYTFMWPDEEEAAMMIGRRTGEVIRFRRLDEEDPNAYFEFRVRIDAMTNEVALIVTDHAWPHEVEETRNLWASQVANLIRVLGA
ncbi:MAG: START-like domain-containing protein [Flavobacteriales bacterium]